MSIERPTHNHNRVYPRDGRDSSSVRVSTNEVPVVNKRTLGRLRRQFVASTNIISDDRFRLRRTKHSQILTPLTKDPIVPTQQDGKGSRNGGTSREAIKRAKRKVKRSPNN